MRGGWEGGLAVETAIWGTNVWGSVCRCVTGRVASGSMEYWELPPTLKALTCHTFAGPQAQPAAAAHPRHWHYPNNNNIFYCNSKRNAAPPPARRTPSAAGCGGSSPASASSSRRSSWWRRSGSTTPSSRSAGGEGAYGDLSGKQCLHPAFVCLGAASGVWVTMHSLRSASGGCVAVAVAVADVRSSVHILVRARCKRWESSPSRFRAFASMLRKVEAPTCTAFSYPHAPPHCGSALQEVHSPQLRGATPHRQHLTGGAGAVGW